ncbi:MAG: AraC family transcriptional regulator [Bacteroidales bacterium]|nr:AraC family transcriptional regulator [Bacteroidales bacterium]
MKPLFEKVLLPSSPFIIKEEHFERFDIQWHIHPEFELSYIFQGAGTLNIGDYSSEIGKHELLLLGPNLPHSWYGVQNIKPAFKAKQIVIQFPYDFLGKDFFQNQALAKIKELLSNSFRGIRFYDPQIQRIAVRIRRMLHMPDFERTIELLNILNILAQSKHCSTLSSIGYSNHLNEHESARLNSIYKFILYHFRMNIGLKAVSEFANMTPQAFSKYFKERTRKNFITFLNEVKIGYACRLINEKKMNISQICYECGYTNLSNFNRQFKRIMQQTPTQYAKQFM